MRRQVLGGRYHLDDVLGVGGMSTVWRASDDVLGRHVAVKLLSGCLAGDSASRERIRVEARAAAALAHPNVAQVYDFGETVEDGRPTPYVVMELVPGPTLDERAATGPLPAAVVFRVGAEVAAGLAAAHASGLVHRDVKPANVILAPTGAKVVDFGIAAAAGAGDVGDEVLGTADYLAPERLTDDAVTPASDVYSLGVLLYRLLAGRLPWAVSGNTDLLDAHMHTPPGPLPPLDDVPAEVVELCLRCLAKSPTVRPTAQEVAATLAEAAGVRTVTDDLAHSVAPPAADGGPSTILVRPAAAGRGNRTRVAAGLLAVAGAVTLGWALVPEADHDPAPTRAQADAAVTEPATIPSAPATAGAPPPSGTAPTQPASTALPRTFTSAGGSVRARCTPAGLAELVDWSPAAPYKVDWADPGPAPAATAAFTHGNRTAAVTVTCAGTNPVATTH
ncbi:serine/threonine-protein kinase [Dactylosporangium sp. AC04546]|uniref:serine/threonine-protein kinase n=1 Tax=Dactylosporangium sp. AC04546 TaxID=2862460 RepID=UPI001EE03EB0|nr:serine/threonine-protein kinase [Dactylosporangium sp. AC04546]WVK78724.1 serine/threonine-protein kinase [Dactylosporangium sp. AC04546]